jgi:hypothetical protein
MKKIALSLLFTLSFIYASAQMAEHKIIELKNIVTLTAEQEQQIRKLYTDYSKMNDSIYTNEKDPVAAARKKQEVSKNCHIGVMNVLSDQQKVKYIQVIKTPEVMAKAESKIQVLRETNQYTEDELIVKKNEIFNYLMLEKVVYTRDKYNFAKQKENIAKLKLIKPNSLKESETREKLKTQGKVQNGNINW